MINFKDTRTRIVIGFVILIGIMAVLIVMHQPGQKKAGIPNTDEQPVPTEFPQNEITVSNNGFEPAIIRVKANTVVVWKNVSDNEISINSDPYPENNAYPELNLGNVVATVGSTQVFLSNPGTYTYHNNFNPKQRGVIIVE